MVAPPSGPAPDAMIKYFARSSVKLPLSSYAVAGGLKKWTCVITYLAEHGLDLRRPLFPGLPD